MPSNIDLNEYAKNLIAPNTTGIDRYDLNAMREAAQDNILQTADDLASSSYANAESLIDCYEREAGDVEDFGQTFKASEYLEAMTAFAYAISREMLSRKVDELLGDVAAVRDEMEEEWDKVNPDELLDDGAIRVTRDCPYGWAAHDYEEDTSAGDTSIMVWKSGQLDGGNGIAVEVSGIWLSAYWGA